MTTERIENLFASDVRRPIEEVIKVDQVDDAVLALELDEYVVTEALDRHFETVLERYLEAMTKPTEGVGIWIAGFFGSGKSSFAKMLGLAIQNRAVAGRPAADRLAARTRSDKLRVLLKTITEKLPTHAVIFDVSTDRGIRSGNQTLREIMYRQLLGSLGYARDLDLSELEIGLEGRGQLAPFEETYHRLKGKNWNVEKHNLAFALNEASHVMSQIDPDTYPQADSWIRGAKSRSDISAGLLAERANLLMERRKPGHRLLFVVDEIGQFVARDVDRMLDLQGIVQNLGVKGRGRHWLAVTSQERLDAVVSGLDARRVEIARLLDRFPVQVSLEPSDIAEVTSRRVLAKKADGQQLLGKLHDSHKGRLESCTRLTTPGFPALTRQGFIDLHPLLPYQVDLIIGVVSGLRTRGGTFVHVGGANRTIIKLAQQLLVNSATNLAEQPPGTLARLDQVYDLVEESIDSETRAKIKQIARDHSDPMAARVAKAITLLRHDGRIARSAENLAAVLHSGVTADSQLAAVSEALRALEAEHRVRRGEDGYRIPTAAEDDWAQLRMSLEPRPGQVHRLLGEALAALWEPVPSALLAEVQQFKGGLAVYGKQVADGDLVFHFYLAEDAHAMQGLLPELKARSQQEKKAVFWAVELKPEVDRETTELYRSSEMLARKERDAKTKADLALVGEETQRRREHDKELKRLLQRACLSGTAYFGGNDRSVGDAASLSKAASAILQRVLPDVFNRFHEAAAKVSDAKKGLEALLAAVNLQGLPPLFSALKLLRDENGKLVFWTDAGPLRELLARIEERASYGEPATGRWLESDLGKEPFGWDFEVIRLLVACLLSAGKIEATSKGQKVASISTLVARETFSNNNLFRQASFRPRKGIEFEALAHAAEGYRDTFGGEIKNLTPEATATDIQRELGKFEDGIASAVDLLRNLGLEGLPQLESAQSQMKAILRGDPESAIGDFNASHRSLKEAIRRAADIGQALTPPRLKDLENAKRALAVAWPFLDREADLDPEHRKFAAELQDYLHRETFFQELPFIEQRAYRLLAEYDRRRASAVSDLRTAYQSALERLHATDGWEQLSPEHRSVIEQPLERCATEPEATTSIPQLRAERDACGARLHAAVAALHRMIEGERLVTLDASAYFGSGIENQEQLDQALKGLREACEGLLGQGKKVVVQ